MRKIRIFYFTLLQISRNTTLRPSRLRTGHAPYFCSGFKPIFPFSETATRRTFTCSTIFRRRPTPIRCTDSTIWTRPAATDTWRAKARTSARIRRHAWRISTGSWPAWRTRWSSRTISWTRRGACWPPYSTRASCASPTSTTERRNSKTPNSSRTVSTTNSSSSSWS